MSKLNVMSRLEWIAEGARRFGPDVRQWAFVCPCCGHRQSVSDYAEAGAPDTAIGFSCVGRWAGAKRDAFGGKGDGPCNYAGGGLFRVSPVKVVTSEGHETLAFAFAEVSR